MKATLEILSPGFHSSVQDLGRFGFSHLGVSAGGAADAQAFKIGNRLVGNHENAAAIEMIYSGANVRFLLDTWVALTGADCHPRLNDTEMSTWYSFKVRTGDRLSLGSLSNGARTYLCVHGGIHAPEVLSSRSTFLASDSAQGWGGFKGRPLQTGDRLTTGEQIVTGPAYRRAGIMIRALYRNSGGIVRVTPGPQYNWFTDSTQEKFYQTKWTVSAEADRRGLRLTGETILLPSARELVTEGVSYGAIQIPPAGAPVILMCDQQTTGGYPKIASVARVDLHKLAQVKPGDHFEFKEISLEEAWRANNEREHLCRRPLI